MLGVTVVLGTVTVPIVTVKVAVLIERVLPEEAGGPGAGTTGLTVSMTVYVLVATTSGLTPDVMVVVKMKVETASTGTDTVVEAAIGDVGVGSASVSEQPTAPGQSRVMVTVPI